MNTLLILLLTYLIPAQTNTVTVGTATYTYRTSRDIFEQSATLTFSDEGYKFVYRQIDGPYLDLEKGIKSQRIYSDRDGHVFYQNHLTGKSKERMFLQTNAYLIEDSVVWSWSLENETKEIAGFDCNKATASFRGRNYTAWFATDIPVNAGPWKFFGLPGLIMEVSDDSGLVSFQINNLQYPDPSITEPLSFDHKGETIDYPELRKRQMEHWTEKGKRVRAKASRMMAENPSLSINITRPDRPYFMETFDFELEEK